MDDVMEVITGLNANLRGQVIRWTSTFPESEYIAIVQESLNKYHSLKSQYAHVPRRYLQYCSLILVGRERGWDTIRGRGYRVAGIEQFEDWSNNREMKIQNLRQSRPSPKKRKVLSYWGEVRELKNGGIGFRKIAQYLKKYRKVSVSPAYIHYLWEKIEK